VTPPTTAASFVSRHRPAAAGQSSFPRPPDSRKSASDGYTAARCVCAPNVVDRFDRHPEPFAGQGRTIASDRFAPTATDKDQPA